MNRLKILRKEKGLSQQALAKEIGVSYRTLQNWENGVNSIKPDKAQALADYFGVSVGYLLGFEVIETEKTELGLIAMMKKLLNGEKLDNDEALLAEKISNAEIPLLHYKESKQNKKVVLDELIALREKMDKMIEEMEN
ncbi:TPA: helix-turn-helix domain-containing protein [Streptococcus suis]|nr:helix-turn-helix domain-containing protein [Streptococcus suis]